MLTFWEGRPVDIDIKTAPQSELDELAKAARVEATMRLVRGEPGDLLFMRLYLALADALDRCKEQYAKGKEEGLAASLGVAALEDPL